MDVIFREKHLTFFHKQAEIFSSLVDIFTTVFLDIFTTRIGQTNELLFYITGCWVSPLSNGGSFISL
jgi:hypothetical protein